MPQKVAAREPVVDWTRVFGGALAAVSSAVLLSTLGAVGTLVGAALGSIVISVSTSVYARGLNRSRHHMAQAQDAALRRVGVAQAEVRRARRRADAGATDAHLDRADERLAEAQDQLDTTPEPTSLRRRLGQLPWSRVGLVAALMFVIAVVFITGFELVAGRSLASFTGGTDSNHGTSFSNLEHSGNSPTTPSPSPSSPVPSSASSAGSSSSPSASPSSSPSGSSSGTPTPSPSPSTSPTGLPSATTTASAPAG